jgi:hypothetical protein
MGLSLRPRATAVRAPAHEPHEIPEESPSLQQEQRLGRIIRRMQFFWSRSRAARGVASGAVATVFGRFSSGFRRFILAPQNEKTRRINHLVDRRLKQPSINR